MGPPNEDLLPDDLDDLVHDALVRAGLPTHCYKIYEEAIVVQRKGGVIVVPVAVRTIEAPPTDEEAPHAYDTHLVIKHVDLNNWDFKNDGTARERTRESFAKECAFYRDVVAASRASRGGRNEVVTRAFDPINGWGMAQMETGADGWAVPTAHLVEGDETSDVFTLVMADAMGKRGGKGKEFGPAPSSPHAHRAINSDAIPGLEIEDTPPLEPIARQVSVQGDYGELNDKMGMTPAEAEATVEWLAAFHARHWLGLPDSPVLPYDALWSRGGHWTLEKREHEVCHIEREWARLVSSFPGVPELERRRDLGERLQRRAGDIARCAHARTNTLLHGDLKAANIIMPNAVSGALVPIVFDWQWAGPGCAAADLAFFIATSLSREASEMEDALVTLYHERLTARLRARGSSEADRAADSIDMETLRRDMDANIVDYVRFCAGSVWGPLTPASMEKHRHEQNIGIARRSLWHLARLVERAGRAMDVLERREFKTYQDDVEEARREAERLEREKRREAQFTRTVSGISIFSQGEYQSLCGGGVVAPQEGGVRFRSDSLDPLPEAEDLPGGVGDEPAAYEVTLFTQIPPEVVQSLEEHWSGLTAMPEIVGT